jgi:hypothetical protein
VDSSWTSSFQFVYEQSERIGFRAVRISSKRAQRHPGKFANVIGANQKIRVIHEVEDDTKSRRDRLSVRAQLPKRLEAVIEHTYRAINCVLPKRFNEISEQWK